MDYNALAQKYGGTQVQPSQPTQNPQSQGVDYAALAQQYGGTTQTPPNNTGGIWSAIGNGIKSAATSIVGGAENLMSRPGQLLGQLGLEAANTLSSGELDKWYQSNTGHTLNQGIDAATNESQTTPLGTQTRPISQDTPENVSGDALTTVALGAPGVTSGGALFGAGSAMQQNASAGDVAVSTLTNAIAGKILDLGFSAAMPYVTKAAQQYGQPFIDSISQYIPKSAEGFMQKLTDSLPDVSNTKILSSSVSSGINKTLGAIDNTGDFVAQKVASIPSAISDANPFKVSEEARVNQQLQDVKDSQENVANAYKDTLPLTPTERAKEQAKLDKTGDNVYTTLAKNNINVGSEEAIPQLQSISDRYENAINYAQANEHATFDLNQIKANAFDKINKNIDSSTGRVAAKNQVSKEIDAIVKEQRIKPNQEGKLGADAATVERLRRTGNDWGQYNQLNPDSVKNGAGRALADSVRDQVEKEGTFPAYRYANREWGKIIHAQNVLQDIAAKGKDFRQIGGLSGSIARKLLAGVIGLHTGGIGGVIVDEIGSEYAAKILANPQLRTYFDRKLIEEFGTTKTTPDAISKLTQEVKDYIDKQGTILKLPAPKPLGSPENPIITPQPTTYEKSAEQSFTTRTNKTGDAYRRNLKTGKLEIIPRK